MKGKQLTLLVLLILPIIGIAFLPISQAAITNIWGVTIGDTKTYRLYDEVRGSVTGVLEDYYIQYNVISVQDVNSNNVTDVIVSMLDLSTDPITVTQMTLADTGPVVGFPLNLAFWVLTDAVAFWTGIIATLYTLLVPITSSGGVGINWMTALSDVNTSMLLPDYTGYDQGNRALITYILTDQLDSNLGAFYNLSGTIIWDKTTGWLTSLEYVRTYDEAFGFTIHHIIEQSSPPSRLTTAQIVRDVFAWTGLGVAIVGLCFTVYVYKKMR